MEQQIVNHASFAPKRRNIYLPAQISFNNCRAILSMPDRKEVDALLVNYGQEQVVQKTAKSFDILLGSVDKVKAFVNDMSNIEGDVLLCVGKYVIDAKSIMGISASFRPSNPCSNKKPITQAQKVSPAPVVSIVLSPLTPIYGSPYGRMKNRQKRQSGMESGNVMF